jgi:hypothetical protein
MRDAMSRQRSIRQEHHFSVANVDHVHIRLLESMVGLTIIHGLKNYLSPQAIGLMRDVLKNQRNMLQEVNSKRVILVPMQYPFVTDG